MWLRASSSIWLLGVWSYGTSFSRAVNVVMSCTMTAISSSERRIPRRRDRVSRHHCRCTASHRRARPQEGVSSRRILPDRGYQGVHLSVRGGFGGNKGCGRARKGDLWPVLLRGAQEWHGRQPGSRALPAAVESFVNGTKLPKFCRGTA